MRKLSLYILLIFNLVFLSQISAHKAKFIKSTSPVLYQTNEDFINFDVNDYPITEEGLPQFAKVYQLDTLCQVDDIIVQLHYPEWVALTQAERRIIAKNNLCVDTLKIQQHLSISRKKGVLEVTFSPIVKKNDEVVRLKSAKVDIKIISSNKETNSLKNHTIATISAERWKDSSVLKTGRWVKIRVAKEGIYQLTSAFLKKNGFNNIDKVKVYGYGGRPIEENWTFNQVEGTPDDLCEVPLYRKNDGTALFFAEGTVRFTQNGQHEKNPYSDYSYYFLTEGENPAIFSTLEAESQTTDSVLNHVPYCTYIDNDKYVWYSGGRELYDDFDFAYNNQRTINIATPQPATNIATLHIAMAASSKSSNTIVDVKWGGSELGRFTINKYGTSQSAYETRKVFNLTKINAENSIQLTTTQGNSARLNFIRVNYDRMLDAQAAPYAFSPQWEGTAVLQINNATINTKIWAIGNRTMPTAEVKSTLKGNSLIAPITDGMRRYIFFDVDGTFPTPESVGEIGNQNLHADGPYDMIIIISENKQLESEAHRLAAAHKVRQGLRVRVIDAGSLYNEFSSGTPDASAYRRYLKMLYDKAASEADMPKYLILFGDCAWDNKMQTTEWNGYNPKDFLLAFEVSDGALNKTDGIFPIGELNSYVTDDFYGWLDDNEGNNYAQNRLDLAIGRILCLDIETAKAIVDKTIDYMDNKNAGAWKNKIFMLADYGNKNLHMNDAIPVVAQINASTEQNAMVKQIFWDAYDRETTGTGFRFPSVTKKLQQQMQSGALMFNYTGHGSPEQISYAKILSAEDFNLSSQGKLPLWVMASCEISPFDTQVNDIGRTALSNPDGGAFAVICAARSVYSNYNRELNTTLCKYLFTKNEHGKYLTIGEALRKTKVDMLAGGNVNYNRDGTINKLKYVLLGDPALSLALPTGKVVLDSINGEKIDENTQVQIKAGSIVSFSGHISDNDGGIYTSYQGLITGTLEDRLETITCKNYDKADNAITFKERTKTIYEGADSIKNGKFKMIIRIPRDISYSNDNARITFYSKSNTDMPECHGYADCFYLNGTDRLTEPDTLAPQVKTYIDSRFFTNGGTASSSPTLIADITDDFGINIAQGSLGNNMELVIDNEHNSAIDMSQHFSFDFGCYNKGSISYPMGEMSPGQHNLSLRVSDINGNTTTTNIDFYIPIKHSNSIDIVSTQNPVKTETRFICTLPSPAEQGGYAEFEVYDLSGRRLWRSAPCTISTGGMGAGTWWNPSESSSTPVNSGIYLYRAKVVTGDVTKVTKAKKIIVIRQ